MFDSIFGPSREEIWRELAQQTGGAFVKSGSLFPQFHVELVHGEWTILLDTFVVPAGKAMIPFTRFRAPLHRPDTFRFRVYRASVLSGIGKFFGMQDIEVGSDEFDRDFIVQSNDESAVKRLLSDYKLRSLIQAQPSFHLEIEELGDWSPKVVLGREHAGVSLMFKVPGFVKDLEQLRGVYEIFAEALDQMSRLGHEAKRA